MTDPMTWGVGLTCVGISLGCCVVLTKRNSQGCLPFRSGGPVPAAEPARRRGFKSERNRKLRFDAHQPFTGSAGTPLGNVSPE